MLKSLVRGLLLGRFGERHTHELEKLEGFLPAAPSPGACTHCEYRPVCGPYEETRAGKKSPERLVKLRLLRALP